MRFDLLTLELVVAVCEEQGISRAVGSVYSWSRVSAAFAGLLIGFFQRQGGTVGVALFIGGAMVLMIITIGGFGPRTLNLQLEEISH